MATNRDSIFISYSHNDVEWLERLLIFLKGFPWGRPHQQGGRVWADRWINVGARWRREVGDGLARARVAALLVSPDFLGSDFIASDELPSLLEAAAAGEVTVLCVPVRSSVVDLARKELLEYQWPRPFDQPLDLLSPAEREAALAQVFRALFEVAQSLGLTENAQESAAARPPPAAEARRAGPLRPARTRGKLFGVLPLRPHHMPRRDVRDRLKAALLSGPHASVGITGSTLSGRRGKVGLFGQGGLGKTVAAIDLVNQEDVQLAFPDGVFWLTLGQSPDVAGLQVSLIEQLTGAAATLESVAAGSARIRELLVERACLLVLDDVWRYEHVCAFDVAGERCRLLLTTRDAGVLTALRAREIELDVLGEPEALDLLAAWVDQPAAALPPEARALVKRCGYLPLAISVAGALLRDGTAWSAILAALQAGNVRFLEHPFASVFTSLRLSVEALPARDRERYLELAVVPEDVPMPASVVVKLWSHAGGMPAQDCHALLAELQRRALLYLERDGDSQRLRLHDLQRDYLQLAATDLARLHALLLEAHAAELASPATATHRAWWSLPDDEPYLWQHLAGHLSKSTARDELRALTLDYRWLSAKLARTDVTGLLSDFAALSGDRASDLVQGALRLSAHVLAKDSRQLASQLTGRLLRDPDPEIRGLLEQAREATEIPWLRPLAGTLTPPGGPLVRTLQGHRSWVHAVAVTPDGRRAVSASWDTSLRIWDLETGGLLHTLKGHAGAVQGVAVTPDGSRAVSASWDNKLKVWDLETGTLQGTLEGHGDSVAAVAVTADGTRVISASLDRTLKVWDLVSGTARDVLEGHKGAVTAVAVTPDGTRAVSASWDKTVRVWDLATGGLLHTLLGHAESVNGVAVTSDARHAVSASSDGTLKLWDIGNGSLLQTLEGHASWVTAVALSPDGRRAVSGSRDTTLRVWDLQRAALLQTLEGHSSWVTGIAVTADGKRAVSASADATVKVWDLATPAQADELEGHDSWLTGLAVTPDGKQLISASRNGTVKIWDMATQAVVRTYERHARSVHRVAVVPDGRRAVSACAGAALMVWDIATGAVLRTLKGHSDSVHAVAVTPDGKRVLSASADGTLKLWDLESGAALRTLEGHAKVVFGVALTPDGKRAVSAARDDTLKLWDLETGEVLLTRGHASWVSDVAVTPDGRSAVSASRDKTLRIWDLDTGALAHTLKGHSDSVYAVAITPDGRLAVSVSADSSMKVWDIRSGAMLATFSADGPLLACAVAAGAVIVLGDALGRVHFLRFENR